MSLPLEFNLEVGDAHNVLDRPSLQSLHAFRFRGACPVPSSANEDAAVHLSSGGLTPRELSFAGPNAELLLVANQDDNAITAYAVDADSGALSKRGATRCPTPVCLLDLGPAAFVFADAAP